MKKILSAFFAAFLLASLCALPAFAVSQARSVNATTTAETMSLVCEYCGQSDMICVDEYYASWYTVNLFLVRDAIPDIMIRSRIALMLKFINVNPVSLAPA